MGLEVLIPGFLSTIQDLGRWGYQDKGVSPSGFMDTHAAILGNILVGNDPGEAMIESALGGLQIKFTRTNVIAVCGARVDIHVDQRAVGMNTAVTVRSGQTLTIGCTSQGMWIYLAFAGGLDIPKVMGSRSTNVRLGLGGMHGRKLKSGDQIAFRRPTTQLLNQRLRHFPSKHLQPPKDVSIRLLLGPQAHFFGEEAVASFLSSRYTIASDSDRTGYRLNSCDGSLCKGYDIITDGTVFGSVQIPPSGKPIIMMADHQTTGGYAKIATVISADLPLLAQCQPGAVLRFVSVSITEAQALIDAEAIQINKLKESFENYVKFPLERKEAHTVRKRP